MKKIILLIFTLLFLNLGILYAGYPIGKGRTALCLTTSYFYSDSYYDLNWKKQGSPNIFSSYYLSTFIGHGISRRLDVFGSLPYVFETSKNDTIILKRNGFSDVQLGFAYTLHNKFFNKYTSFKVVGIFPVSHGSNPMSLSYDSKGIEYTINYSSSPKLFSGKGNFIEGTYRHYFATDGPDQYILTVQHFKTIMHYTYLTYGMNITYSQSTNTFNQLINNSSKDFFNLQLKFDLCRKVRRNLSLYFEGYYTPIGKNTGAGIGASIFGVLRLP